MKYGTKQNAGRLKNLADSLFWSEEKLLVTAGAYEFNDLPGMRTNMMVFNYTKLILSL